MIKAAFFDVDGTLLSHKTKTVSQSTRRALEQLQKSGIECIVATGRHICQFAHLPVDDVPFDGYITLNGQLVLDQNREVLFGTPITGKTKDFLIGLFSDHVIPALIVEEEAVYLNFEDDRVRLVQEAISTPVPHLGTYSGADIYQFCAYLAKGDEKVLDPIRDACVMTRWNIGGVDVFAKGGGKVTGIKRFLEANGIAPEETIAFGDGENDMDMLTFAGIGIAMGNADEQVKQCADYVTADVDEDGIEKALKHFGIL